MGAEFCARNVAQGGGGSLYLLGAHYKLGKAHGFTGLASLILNATA